MTTPAARRQFGDGPLYRAAARLYTLLTVDLLTLAAASPGLAVLLALGRGPADLAPAVACALPLGPALSAALYALRRGGTDASDLHPARAFARGYRLNALPVLKIWTPWLAWLAIVATTLAHFSATGLPTWWAALLAALAAGSTLWIANALLISTFFVFRTVDTARLAAYFLLRGRATLALACLLTTAAGGALLISPVVPVLLAPLLLTAFLHNARPLLTETEQDFTA